MLETNEMINVRLWRGNISGGFFKAYQVPVMESQTVLDVVTWIQRNLEPNLAYRFACRVGMCGSCAMTVNGKPRWTCRTHVEKVMKNNEISIEPLRNLPIIKDLACDLSEFFEKWTKAKGRFVPTTSCQQAIEKINPQSTERMAANAGIECINCAVCYAACDVVESDPNYLGPAALNRAWTLINDVKDAGNAERIRAVTAEGGCQGCHSQQGCTSYCPNDINPTLSIAGLKRAAAMALLKGKV